MDNYLYTVAEVSKILQINKNAVYKLINRGVLQGLKLGSMKVTKFELLRFFKKYNGKDLSDLDNIKPIKIKEE